MTKSTDEPHEIETTQRGHARGRPGVLMVTGIFPPHSIVGVIRSAKFAKYLSQLGFRCEVLAYRPRRDIEPVDEKSLAELPPDVVVHRTWFFDPLSWPLRFQKRFGRHRADRVQSESAVTYATSETAVHHRAGGLRESIKAILLHSPDRLISWIPSAVIRGFGPARWSDCIFSSSPPYTTHVVALLLHRLTRRPMVIDFRDPWVDHPRTDLAGERHWAFHRWIEAACVRRARFVIHATDEARHAMSLRYPREPAEKFVTIYNGFDESEMPPIEHRLERSDQARPLQMAYFGLLYGTRSPLPLLDALRILREEHGVGSERVRLNLVGAASDHTRASIGERGLAESVTLTDRVPREQALLQMCRSDLLVLIGSPDLDRFCIATKVYEYMATGRPILALVPPGPITQVLSLCGVGHVAPPDDAREIARLLKVLLARHEQQGLPLEPAKNLDRFTRRTQARQLADLLNRAVAKA